MIHPKYWHPDYEKNIQKLEKDGWRAPQYEELMKAMGDMPPPIGGETFLINDKGALKSVSQATGTIMDYPPLPTNKKNPPGPRFG